MLQEETIADLALPEIGEDTYTTASGDEVKTTVHVASLSWLGDTRRVSVLSTKGRTGLLGMGLLFECSLAMEPSRGVLRITR
jgi:predicted aspartyl protease